jgi:predicted lactoylglutathione lyase
VLAAARHLGQQVGAADDFQQALEAQARQDLANLLGDEREEVDDLVRRAGELGAQGLVLGADPDRDRCWSGTGAP